MSVITELEMIRLVDMIKKLCQSGEDAGQGYQNATDLVADWIIQNKIQVI